MEEMIEVTLLIDSYKNEIVYRKELDKAKSDIENSNEAIRHIEYAKSSSKFLKVLVKTDDNETLPAYINVDNIKWLVITNINKVQIKNMANAHG